MNIQSNNYKGTCHPLGKMPIKSALTVIIKCIHVFSKKAASWLVMLGWVCGL